MHISQLILENKNLEKTLTREKKNNVIDYCILLVEGSYAIFSFHHMRIATNQGIFATSVNLLPNACELNMDLSHL